jgi:hypothetical protein
MSRQRWELAESQLSMPLIIISKVDLFYGERALGPSNGGLV